MLQRKAWMIYNPAAGRFPAAPLLGRAARVLNEAGWSVHMDEGGRMPSVTQAAREAVEAKAEAVFVVGGDGSVGQVADVLAGSDTALGVLPAGTANVWAQELGLPRLDWIHWYALEQAAERLANGKQRLVDLGTCNGNNFLLWAGVGLDAYIVNSIEPRERWEKAFGAIHYATLALWNASGWEGVELQVDAGSQHFEGRFLIAVASNIPAYAGGLVDLAPAAKVDDGLLDFWLITGASLSDALMRVAQIFMGRLVKTEGVISFQSAKATFLVKGSAPIQCDGEPFPASSTIEFGVKPRCLRVLVPDDERNQRVFSVSSTNMEGG
jgi:YegS/Rv2252/BmrU family lipid kinase